MHERLKDKLRQVFARMVKHRHGYFYPAAHRCGGRVHQWRNWVDFDPLESYGGYTYDELMIGTIANALAETADDETDIEMALSGEMGTSIVSLSGVLSNGRSPTCASDRDLKQLKLGISLNHGGIAGRGNPTGAKDDSSCRTTSSVSRCNR